MGALCLFSGTADHGTAELIKPRPRPKQHPLLSSRLTSKKETQPGKFELSPVKKRCLTQRH